MFEPWGKGVMEANFSCGGTWPVQGGNIGWRCTCLTPLQLLEGSWAWALGYSSTGLKRRGETQNCVFAHLGPLCTYEDFLRGFQWGILWGILRLWFWKMIENGSLLSCSHKSLNNPKSHLNNASPTQARPGERNMSPSAGPKGLGSENHCPTWVPLFF